MHHSRLNLEPLIPLKSAAGTTSCLQDRRKRPCLGIYRQAQCDAIAFAEIIIACKTRSSCPYIYRGPCHHPHIEKKAAPAVPQLEFCHDPALYRYP